MAKWNCSGGLLNGIHSSTPIIEWRVMSCFSSLLLSSVALNLFKWFRMVRNGSKWFQMVPNGSKWFQMIPNGLNYLSETIKAPVVSLALRQASSGGRDAIKQQVEKKAEREKEKIN